MIACIQFIKSFAICKSFRQAKIFLPSNSPPIFACWSVPRSGTWGGKRLRLCASTAPRPQKVHSLIEKFFARAPEYKKEKFLRSWWHPH